MWHILKSCQKKIRFLVDKASIFFTIHKLVYDSQFVDEFEEGWLVMIEKYNLQEDPVGFLLFENYFLGRDANN